MYLFGASGRRLRALGAFVGLLPLEMGVLAGVRRKGFIYAAKLAAFVRLLAAFRGNKSGC